MTRSVWKPPVLLPYGLSKKPRHQINTCFRHAVIGPELIGLTVYVHNGMKFIPVHVSENHVGFKLGSFCLTKKRVKHKKKKTGRN